MVAGNGFDLLLPQIDRTLSENVEQAVILDGSQGQLENLTNEIRHYRTAPSPLRLQVRDCRNRHVVLKFKYIEPVLVAVHRTGPKATNTVLLRICVDLNCPALKSFEVEVHAAIVVQIVQVGFKAPSASPSDQLVDPLIAAFRNKLKSRLKTKGVVQVHQRLAVGCSAFFLHVMRQNACGVVPIRPKPDERDLASAAPFDNQPHQGFENL